MNSRVRLAWIFLIGVAVCLVLLVLVVAILTSASKSTEIRETQESRVEQVESNDRTLRVILNCTTPGRGCYERGQRQLAAAVGDINRVVVLAAACASGPAARTEAAIQRCIVERLGKGER